MDRQSFNGHAKAWQYVEDHELDQETGLVALARAQALEAGLPQSSAAQGRLLATLATLNGATSAIVVGTGALVETAQLIEGLAPAGKAAKLTAVDSSSAGIAQIRSFFNAVSDATDATLRAVAAPPAVYLTRLNAQDYDLLVVSGDPGNYAASFEQAPRLLRRGGAIVFTDALAMGGADGDAGLFNAADRSPKAVAMRELIGTVQDDERFVTSLTATGTGLLIAVMR